jgi:hypothetical protein
MGFCNSKNKGRRREKLILIARFSPQEIKISQFASQLEIKSNQHENKTFYYVSHLSLINAFHFFGFNLENMNLKKYKMDIRSV